MPALIRSFRVCDKEKQLTMLHFRKWFLAVFVVMLATMLGFAGTTNASPPAVMSMVTGTSDQAVVLTGTVLVGHTMGINATSLANFRAETVMVANNSTAPANIAYENGTAIVNTNNTAKTGVQPIAAKALGLVKTGQDGVFRKAEYNVIKPHTLLTTLAAATG